MARGKTPNATQRNLLILHGYDPTQFMYLKQHTIDDEGFKSSSRNTSKTIYNIFQNRYTKEEIRIEV